MDKIKQKFIKRGYYQQTPAPESVDMVVVAVVVIVHIVVVRVKQFSRCFRIGFVFRVPVASIARS